MERAPRHPSSAEEALRHIERALFAPDEHLYRSPELFANAVPFDFPFQEAATAAGPSNRLKPAPPVAAPDFYDAGGFAPGDRSVEASEDVDWPLADLLDVEIPERAQSEGPLEVADEESQDDDNRPSGREARKRAEKNRRTTLTQLVSVLSSLLPTVKSSPRKIDKIGVLRLAAHQLRQNHVFGRALAKKCSFRYEAAEAFLRLFDGFFLCITVHGFIVIASPNVQQILGHPMLDLLGASVYTLVHPDDADKLKQNLSTGKKGERRDFVVRLMKAGARGEAPSYVYCRLRGGFRPADHAGTLTVEGRPLPRRQRVRREHPLNPEGNDLVIVALGQVMPDPPVIDRLLEASKLEYWTRHLIDGRIIHCDQRIALVAGYMCEEVLGMSAFSFMHKEDVRWVIIALRQMYDQTHAFGESCYRLVSRNGRFMYLRTRGYLEIDTNTKVANSFVCMNTLVSNEEGSQLIVDMKRKFTAEFNVEADESQFYTPSDLHHYESLEDPAELEHVIMCLIDKLPSSSSSSPQNSPASHVDKNQVLIVPPSPETIKPSIDKSITVVAKNTTRKRVAPDSEAGSGKRQSLESSGDEATQ